MKEQLIHILDQSVCLSRKQMRDYLSGTMQREEMHAAEVHLSSCPLCSMAMEGFEEHSEEALAAIASLNSGFLKEHFDNIAPQIHLNSIAPAAALPSAQASRKRGHIQPIWRNASVAAAVVLTVGVLWFLKSERNSASSPQIAVVDQQETAVPAATTDQAAPDRDRATSAVAYPQEEASGNDPALPAAGHAPVTVADAPASAAAKDVSAVDRALRPEQLQQAPAPAPESVAAVAKLPAREVETRAARANFVPSAMPGDQLRTAAQEKTAGVELPETVASTSKPQPSTVTSVISTNANRTAGATPLTESIRSKKSAEAKPAVKETRTRMELGNESFEKGRYSAALGHFKQQMNQGSPRERAQARIMAARCYAALGNKAKAEELLQAVVEEGSGQERRAARKVLRSLK